MNIKKLENSARIAELSPKSTLERIGVDDDAVLLDYGAGTGVFAIPAAKITKEKVYAYDISRQMLNRINERAENEGIKNLVLLDQKELEENIDIIQADYILMSSVYHHIDDKDALFSQFERMLKKDGEISVIEFHYRDTPLGPGLSHRIKRQDLIDDFTQKGYKIAEDFELGENFYLISFSKSLV